MKGVILAAGKGTRMREITRAVPKPLLLVANKPILEHTIDAFRDSGIINLLVIVQHQKEKIIDRFRDGRDFGVDISYVEQPDMKGTGEAAGLARDFARDDDFILIFGDIVTLPKNITGIMETFHRHRPFMALTVRHVDDPADGAAVYVKNGIVEKIIEKPPPGTSKTNFNNAGIFAFSNRIFALLDQLRLSPRGEYELTDAIRMSIERKLQVRAYELEGYWSNVSSPEDIIAANALVLDEYNKQYLLDPDAKVGDNCSLGPNVCIAGESIVGRQVRMTNSVINRTAAIGDRVNLDYVYVRDNAGIKPDTSLIGRPDKVIVV